MPQPSLERLKNEHWLPYSDIQHIPSDCQGVYLDMISMLQNGEGALVGSTAKALCTLEKQPGGVIAPTAHFTNKISSK